VRRESKPAAATYLEAIALDPELAGPCLQLGGFHAASGQFDQALALAQTATELAPDDPQVSDTLGWIFYRRGIHQRALALLKESAAKLPGNPQIQYHLGIVSAQLGDKEAARQALAFAVAAPAPVPGQDEAKKTLAALKERLEGTGTPPSRSGEEGPGESEGCVHP